MNSIECERQAAYKELNELRNKYTQSNKTDYLNELYNKALKYKKKKSLGFAEVFLTEAINQLENQDTLLKAKLLHSLAFLYSSINKCNEAKPLIIKSLEIKKKLNLQNDETTINSLLVLGSIESKITNYKDSSSTYNTAYNLAVKINKMVEVSLISLGELFIRTQQYEKAEMLLIEALNLSLKSNNEKMIGHSLDTLGYLYSETENYDEAYKKFELSFQILSKQEDISKKLFYPALLHRRAALFIKTGRYTEAKSLLLESLKLKKRYNKQSVPYAIGLHDLAYLCLHTGRYTFAENLFKKAELILNIHPLKNQILLSDFLRSRAKLYARTGRYLDAELIINKVLEIESKNGNVQSKSRIISFYNASYLFYKNHKYSEAIIASEKSISIAIEIIQKVFHLTLQDTGNKYRQYIIKTFHLHLALHFRISNKQYDFNTFLLIYYKAGQLFSTNHTANVFFNNVNSTELERRNDYLKELQEKGYELFKLRYHLASENITMEERESRILILEAEINQFEIKMRKLEAQILPNYKNIIGNKSLEEESLLKAFKHEDIVLEYIKYDDILEDEPEERFCVLIYHPVNHPSVTIHHFNDSKKIDDLVSKLFQFCTQRIQAPQNKQDLFNNIKEELIKKISKELYTEIIKPIERFITNAKYVTLCLDGELTKIPFELLLEDKEIKYLNSISDSLWLNNRFGKSTGISTIAYDAEFDCNQNEALKKQIQFTYLHGTIHEGNRIAKKLEQYNIPHKKIVGPEFTKAEFLKITRPCILHIATHGFYEKNKSKNISLNMPNFKEYISSIDDPYERSGFVVSGINSALGENLNQFKDYVVTAKDILSMDLYGTQLVVLSICSSGQGDIWEGDGIYGLQRALFLSGIKTLVMSLWNADDIATCILMDKMYDSILKGKRVDQSLFEAKGFLRNSTIAELLSRGWEFNSFIHAKYESKNLNLKPYESPNYWACFVCIGNGGSINF